MNNKSNDIKVCKSCFAPTTNLDEENYCFACKKRKNISFDDFMGIFVESEPWYGYLSRYVNKLPKEDFPSIGVSLTQFSTILMRYNPEFFSSLTWAEKFEVMKHEFLHVIFNHLCLPGEEGGARFKKNTNRAIWNISCDLGINSLLKKEALPEEGFYPGRRCKVSKKYLEILDTLDPKIKEIELNRIKQINDFIEKLPIGETSEWYYGEIMNNPDVADAIASNDYFSFDEHDDWFNSLPEEQQEQIKAKIKSILKEACEKDRWGSVPAEMREKLKSIYSNTINWKNVLRMFVGMCKACEHLRTIKKIDRRAPYLHAGVKKRRRSNIAIAIDQSGSVSNDTIELFFSELSNLSQLCDFTVIPFDSEVNDKDVFIWKKNSKVEVKRVKCGGTDFSVPTKWVNDRKKQYDGLIILTDGYCCAPISSSVRRAYIICPDGKLSFATNDVVIQMRK